MASFNIHITNQGKSNLRDVNGRGIGFRDFKNFDGVPKHWIQKDAGLFAKSKLKSSTVPCKRVHEKSRPPRSLSEISAE